MSVPSSSRPLAICCARLLVAFALPGALVAQTAGPAAAVAASDDVWLKFDGTPGISIASVSNSGTAGTTQRIVSSNAGAVRLVTSYPGAGNTADFPAFNGTRTGPRAMVAVTNTGTADMLTPRAGAFAFGADIRLDATNEGSTLDNGNNVIQRGLVTDAAQLKLQVDGPSASCRIAGDLGSVLVTSTLMMHTGSWYRLRCRRVGGADVVTLTVTPIAADGTLGTGVDTTRTAPIGSLTYARNTPLSVGGKLRPDLTVFPRSDQFNGTIDNAFLAVD